PGFGNCSLPSAPVFDDGCETNVASDPDNCGACNRACAGGNVVQKLCSGGLCTSSCGPGFANCSQPPAPALDNGCETNTANDPTNCDACGRTCSSAGVSALACSAGVCSSSCLSGLGNCNQPAAPNPDDGCETNIASHPDHCGACGRACSEQNVASLSCNAG